MAKRSRKLTVSVYPEHIKILEAVNLLNDLDNLSLAARLVIESYQQKTGSDAKQTPQIGDQNG